MRPRSTNVAASLRSRSRISGLDLRLQRGGRSLGSVPADHPHLATTVIAMAIVHIAAEHLRDALARGAAELDVTRGDPDLVGLDGGRPHPCPPEPAKLFAISRCLAWIDRNRVRGIADRRLPASLDARLRCSFSLGRVPGPPPSTRRERSAVRTCAEGAAAF